MLTPNTSPVDRAELRAREPRKIDETYRRFHGPHAGAGKNGIRTELRASPSITRSSQRV